MKRMTKVFGLSCMAALVLAAFAAASAQAHEYEIETEAGVVKTLTKAKASGEEAVKGSNTTNFTLEGFGSTITCTTLSGTGTIKSGGTGSGTVNFTGCTSPECTHITVSSAALSTALTTFGTTLYDVYKPASGTTFSTIKREGCSFSNGEFPVQGETCSEPVSPGTLAVSKEEKYSKAIQEACGKRLTFLGFTVWLTGTAKYELNGTFVGHKWRSN